MRHEGYSVARTELMWITIFKNCFAQEAILLSGVTFHDKHKMYSSNLKISRIVFDICIDAAVQPLLFTVMCLTEAHHLS